MKYNKYKTQKQLEFRDKTIKRQAQEIESLKQMISDMQISCDDKDNIINAIESYHNELSAVIEDLRKQKEEYQNLNNELIKMRDTMNQMVFKGKWKLLKALIK